MDKLKSKLELKKESVAHQSRTAKLWVQYMRYVDIITSKMLYLYAATGNINYAKSVRQYLQMMINRKHDYPWLHVQFTEHGYHSVWRTSKSWAGLWTDLVI